jgi:hypothetical protein
MRLPAGKAAAAFLAIRFTGERIAMLDGMNSKIDRAAGGERPEALRGAESADGHQRRQLVLAVKPVPAGFAFGSA